MATFSFVASGTAFGTTITIPSPAAGDIAVIWSVARNVSGVPGAHSITGFTQVADVSAGAEFRHRTYVKKLDGSETTVTGPDGTTTEEYIAATFHPDFVIDTFVANGVQGTFVNSANPVAHTIGSSAGTPPVIVLGAMSSSSDISPRTRTPTMTEIIGAWGSPEPAQHYAHYKIYGTADTPVNHTYDMDNEGEWNGHQSLYLTFTTIAGQPSVKRGSGVPFMARNRGMW